MNFANVKKIYEDFKTKIGELPLESEWTKKFETIDTRLQTIVAHLQNRDPKDTKRVGELVNAIHKADAEYKNQLAKYVTSKRTFGRQSSLFNGTNANAGIIAAITGFTANEKKAIKKLQDDVQKAIEHVTHEAGEHEFETKTYVENADRYVNLYKGLTAKNYIRYRSKVIAEQKAENEKAAEELAKEKEIKKAHTDAFKFDPDEHPTGTKFGHPYDIAKLQERYDELFARRKGKDDGDEKKKPDPNGPNVEQSKVNQKYLQKYKNSIISGNGRMPRKAPVRKAPARVPIRRRRPAYYDDYEEEIQVPVQAPAPKHWSQSILDGTKTGADIVKNTADIFNTFKGLWGKGVNAGHLDAAIESQADDLLGDGRKRRRRRAGVMAGEMPNPLNEVASSGGKMGNNIMHGPVKVAGRRKGLPAGLSKWMEHLKRFHAAHPNMSYKQAMIAAAKTYRK